MSGIHVAVIDDDPGVHKLLKRVITSLPGTVASAMTAEEIEEALTDPVPAVLLLDLNIPGIDREDLLDRVAAAAPGIRVVVVSGEMPSDVAGLRSFAESLGITISDVLMKPVDLSDLKRAILGA